MERRYIKREALQQWLSKIIESETHLYAPVKQKNGAHIQRVHTADEISFDHVQTTQSVKEIAFPRAEKLFSYKKTGEKVELEDYKADAIPQLVVFGLHPCDAISFKPLSAIFNWDTKDLPFNERMKRTVLIGISCTASDEYCFCTSVHGGPGNTEGSDMLLTPAGEGYLVEVVTDKGKALADRHNEFFEEAPAAWDKEKYLASVPVHFTPEDLQKKLAYMFENDIWKKQSERCLGCGACAFVCPTCACFDIQEDAKGSSGSRLRCWDSCGFSLFTSHTSGHNPRAVQSQRWRQRLLHKFSYMPERLSVVGCTGCGRCSRACPVDMNIQSHLKAIAAFEE